MAKEADKQAEEPVVPVADTVTSSTDERIYPGDVKVYETVDIDGIARGADEPVVTESKKK